MPAADRIRTLGFRRWHERQLIEAHASLVTAFLGVIMVVVCMDQLHWREAGFKPILMVVLIAAGLVLCFKTTAFYFKVLFRAEHFATQAVCSGCGVYGVLAVLSSAAPGALDHGDGDAAGSDWLKVRCKKCGHDWTMTADQIRTPVNKSL